jgi:hypothetical protein
VVWVKAALTGSIKTLIEAQEGLEVLFAEAQA